MPDSTPQPPGGEPKPDEPVKAGNDPPSGRLKFKLPHSPTTGAPGVHVDVQTKTDTHEVLIEPVSPVPAPAAPHVERRAPGPSVTVNPPASAGLTGWSSIIANMTGVTFVMLMFFILYRDSQSNQREFLAQTREERRSDRADNQAAQAAVVAAIQALKSEMGALAISNNTNAQNVNAAVQEMRETRQQIAALVKVFTAKSKPPEEGEMGAAPMPRVRGTGG